MSPLRDRLIVALDFPTAAKARQAAKTISPVTNFFKIGKQLFTAEGPNFVRELVEGGNKVFLDLKYHDIPNTVGLAVVAAAELGVTMLNVHGSGGAKMMRAATEAAAKSKKRPLILAVTVLTSLTDSDLQEVGVAGRALDQVLRLAALARANGCDGVVASAAEAAELRREMGTGFLIVTPGVRPAGSAQNDQARMTTPAEAIAAGATHIVVGRPITGATDPAAAARAVLEEMAMASRNYTTA